MTTFDEREYLQTQLQHWQAKAFDQMTRLIELESQLALTNQKLQEAETNVLSLHDAVMVKEARQDAGEEVPTHQPEPVETPCGCD